MLFLSHFCFTPCFFAHYLPILSTSTSHPFVSPRYPTRSLTCILMMHSIYIISSLLTPLFSIIGAAHLLYFFFTLISTDNDLSLYYYGLLHLILRFFCILQFAEPFSHPVSLQHDGNLRRGSLSAAVCTYNIVCCYKISCLIYGKIFWVL